MKQFLKRTILVITALITLSLPAFAKDSLDHVILKWSPTTEFDIFKKLDLNALMNKKIKLSAFKNSRSERDPKLIGQNIEDEKKSLNVKTDSNVEEFLQAGAQKTLKELGFNLVEEKPDFTINTEITKFFITEKNTYEGSLIARVSLVNATGKTIWTDTVIATNTRFGKSYKLENYLETSSDLVIDFLAVLLKKQEFINQFKPKK